DQTCALPILQQKLENSESHQAKSCSKTIDIESTKSQRSSESRLSIEELHVEISDEETTHKTSDKLRTDSDSEPQSPPKKKRKRKRSEEKDKLSKKQKKESVELIEMVD